MSPRVSTRHAGAGAGARARTALFALERRRGPDGEAGRGHGALEPEETHHELALDRREQAAAHARAQRVRGGRGGRARAAHRKMERQDDGRW
jgi:hypothetical protein